MGIQGNNPAIVVLRQHEGPPRLAKSIILPLRAEVYSSQCGDLLRGHDLVLCSPHALGNPLQCLGAPDKADADVLLGKTPVRLRLVRHLLEVFAPGPVDRWRPATPWSVGPPGILKTHPDRMSNSGVPGILDVVRLIVGGLRFPAVRVGTLHRIRGTAGIDDPSGPIQLITSASLPTQYPPHCVRGFFKTAWENPRDLRTCGMQLVQQGSSLA